MEEEEEKRWCTTQQKMCADSSRWDGFESALEAGVARADGAARLARNGAHAPGAVSGSGAGSAASSLSATDTVESCVVTTGGSTTAAGTGSTGAAGGSSLTSAAGTAAGTASAAASTEGTRTRIDIGARREVDFWNTIAASCRRGASTGGWREPAPRFSSALYPSS